jgi:phosphopantetheinyl transferase
MPLHLVWNENIATRIAVWKIEEDEDFFLRELPPLSNAEEIEKNERKDKRRLEWLACRNLVHQIVDFQSEIYKDQHGKPQLEYARASESDWQISLSHSHGWAAAIVGRGDVGIDIQQVTPKMEKVIHRILSEKEIQTICGENILLQQHLFWGAKEALYKVYGLKNLDFRQHIFVKNVDIKANTEGVFFGFAEGEILKENYHKKFILKFQKFENHLLVWATPYLNQN